MSDLADVPLGDLMKELQRRLECTYKPKKHLILIGALFDQMRPRCKIKQGLLLLCGSFVVTTHSKLLNCVDKLTIMP